MLLNAFDWTPKKRNSEIRFYEEELERVCDVEHNRVELVELYISELLKSYEIFILSTAFKLLLHFHFQWIEVTYGFLT